MSQPQPATITVIAGAANYQQRQQNETTITINSGGRYKRAANPTAAGGIIFISAGMNMALGLGWTQYSLFGGVLHFCYSWFIGVIIGSILSIPLRMFIPKRNIMGSSILLILIGGIIFTSAPYNYDALLAGRYMNGIGIGLAIVPFLILASETASDRSRGQAVAIDQYSISMGIALQMIYSSYWSTVDFSVNRMHGILDIIFAVIAASMLYLFIESPIDQIRVGNEAEAMNILVRLQRPQGNAIETNAVFEQCKMYVREQESMSFRECVEQSFPPLLKMIMYRSALLAFCYTLPLNTALQVTMLITGSSWVPTVAACCRVLGGIVTICVINSVARKVPSLFFYACIGGLLVGFGSIFNNLGNILSLDKMTTASALYIVMQLFVGLFTPYTSVYLAESFPLRVKGYMMDICVIAEQIIQIILIATMRSDFGITMIIQGSLVLFFFIVLCVTLPETKGTSLTEAQRRSKQPLNMKCN